MQTRDLIGCFLTNQNFASAVFCYREAYERFHALHDAVNASFVLGNFARLLRSPLREGERERGDMQEKEGMSGEEAKKQYEMLHWLNLGVDFVLSAACDDSLKQNVHSRNRGVFSS